MAAALQEEPKRPPCAYWLWLNENREKLEAELGCKKGSVVAKHAGQKWKAMTDAQRAPMEKRALELREAYGKAMSEFTAQGGQPGKRRREKAEVKKEKKEGKKARRESKDPDKPKKPPSGYWLWLNESRTAIIAECGTGKGSVVSKFAGQKWKTIPDAQKAPYEEKAKKLKAAFEKEMAAYREKKGAAADDDEQDEDEEEGEEEDDDGTAAAGGA